MQVTDARLLPPDICYVEKSKDKNVLKVFNLYHAGLRHHQSCF